MFTGIIEEIGKVQSITKNNISVMCKAVLSDTKLGDSISLNGVCLTVSKLLPDGFIADISPETLKVTNLQYLNIGDLVNLERAMKADGRFGGHIVSGHIDGLAKYLGKNNSDGFWELQFELDQELEKYTVKKGSIAINGISLTIANIVKNLVTVAIIPHTYENTNLKYIKVGEFVNLETDIFAKYVEKILSMRDNKSSIDLAFLQENGFV
jgi:riboflavin synthase